MPAKPKPKKPSVANLLKCLEISNGRLRDMHRMYEDLVHAAIYGGEWLEEVRNNQCLCRLADDVNARITRKPVIVMRKRAATAEVIRTAEVAE